jgi:hypothetical protein
MEEEAWAAFRVRLKDALSSELDASYYTDNSEQWRQSFRNLCDKLLEEIAAETTES